MEREPQIGDQFFFRSRDGNEIEVSTATKITATRITLSCGKQLVRRSLKQYGTTGWSEKYWRPVTDKNRTDIYNELRRHKAMQVIISAKWAGMSVDTLEQVAEIIKPKESK